MMKRRFLGMLMLSLCLCLMATAALAADATIIEYEGSGGRYSVMMGMATVGDTVYFHVYTHEGEEIWYWQEGMAETAVAASGLVRASDFSCIEDAAEVHGAEKAKYAITQVFSDGERLLALNHLNGLVYEIRLSEVEADFQDVVWLDETYMLYHDDNDERWYSSPNDIAVSGGYLYWNGYGWSRELGRNQNRITRFSLTDGSVTDLTAEDVNAICAYKDGKLMMLQRSTALDWSYDLIVYDPADGSMTPAGRIDGEEYISRIVYAPELDALLYQESTSIMGMKAMGEPQRYAYVNTTAQGKLGVLGDQLILSTVTSTIVRDLVEGLTAPESLQVRGGAFRTAEQNFAAKYTKVPLEIIRDSENEGLVKLLTPVQGEETVDVARLSVGNASDGEFEALKEAGLLMDLSGDPEIKAYVDALYPPFRELVTGENGEIWAVPTEAFGHTGFFVNRKALADIGLTAEDMPTNIVEFCEFVTRWDREFADKFPNYACVEYTEDTRWYVLDMAMEMWIAHCQATGQELHFDDPILREALEAIEKMEVAKTDIGMQVTNPEVSDYKAGLFWMRCQLVGNWASYMEEYSDRIFIPFTLTEDTPFNASVDYVELWVVNRHTESQEYAVKLIQEEMGAVSEKYRHVLLSTATEPVENEYYAESLASAQEDLERLKAELKNAETEEARAEARKQVEQREEFVAAYSKRSVYTITPSAIENYVNVIAPAMYIHRENLMENTGGGTEAMERAMERWLDGKINTEQLIRELDVRLMMLELAQ